MTSFEHGTSCLKSSAKLKGTNIFLNEDVGPATQNICNAKIGELPAAHQRELIAYFSGTKLVTRLKRSTHSSHENAADGTSSRRDNAEQDETELTGCAE